MDTGDDGVMDAKAIAETVKDLVAIADFHFAKGETSLADKALSELETLLEIQEAAIKNRIQGNLGAIKDLPSPHPGGASTDEATPSHSNEANPSHSNEADQSIDEQHLQEASIVEKIRKILQDREGTSVHGDMLKTLINTFIPQDDPQGNLPNRSLLQLYLDGMKQRGVDEAAAIDNIKELFKGGLQPHADDLAPLLADFTIDELASKLANHANISEQKDK